jgi:uncharacterized protein YjdB
MVRRGASMPGAVSRVRSHSESHMRSLSPLPATWSRRGLTLVGAAMLALTTGCDFILGVPSVKRIDVVTVPKDSMPAQTQGQATATVYGDNDKVLNNNSKISVGYASSDPSVATINGTSGAITAIAPGTTVISATSRDKKGEVTLKVTAELVRDVKLTPPTIFLNQRVQLIIDARGANGNSLGKRPATVSTGNQNVVAVESDGTTTGVFLRGVNIGGTGLTVTVGDVTVTTQLTVQPQQVTRVTGGLQKGDNTLVAGESSQTLIQLYGADNAPIGTSGQTITYSSSNQTVATVTGSGVVTAQSPGTAVISINVVGLATPGTFEVKVLERPARQVMIQNRSPFVRLGSNGTGVPSQRGAVAFDSNATAIPNKVISYKSTDPSVFTASTLGTVVGQKLGTALLIASTDNGAVADTISLTVTPMPIVQVRVTPPQATINAGQSQQFTATLTDSVGVVVTGRTITWTSSNPVGIPVNASGLATGANNAGGTATITATTDIIPGQGQISGNASIVVTPTPIASIDVQPTSVTLSLRSSSATIISVIPRDAAGNALVGRTGSINVTPENPAIATGDAAGNIRAFNTGTTHITYQAIDLNGAPQGTPTTITIQVNQ